MIRSRNVNVRMLEPDAYGTGHTASSVTDITASSGTGHTASSVTGITASSETGHTASAVTIHSLLQWTLS